MRRVFELESVAPLLLAAFVLLGGACTLGGDQAEPAPAEPARDAVAERLAGLYADEAVWPTRLWLEEPLLDDSGEVVVPPRRNGVLVYMRPNGDLRVDFGRYGPHTVPMTQTNFVSESERYRSGEATKTLPNLLGMLTNRVVEIDAEVLRPQKLDAEAVKGGRILIVFADAATVDVPAMTAFAAGVEGAGDVRLVVWMPVTEERDGDVVTDLVAGGWTHPFVMTPIARSYVSAMLEPGLAPPFARLASDEGRILAEGPPDDATLAAMREALAVE